MTNFRSIWTIALLAILFVMLLMIGGPHNAVDVAIVRQLQIIRFANPWSTPTVSALTMLGSAYATIGGGLAAIGWLMLRHRRRAALLLAGGVLGERLIADGMKLLVGRPRPDLSAHPVATSSSSFPSGHSANSMAVYLMIALTLAPPQWRRPAVLAALALSLLMGLTRPYLGVHWPSDVLGGWTLGLMAVWAYLWVGDRSGAPEQQHQIVGRHGAALDQAEAMR